MTDQNDSRVFVAVLDELKLPLVAIRGAVQLMEWDIRARDRTSCDFFRHDYLELVPKELTFGSEWG